MVNRLSGHPDPSGTADRCPQVGQVPASIDGTANGVQPPIPVALRYQVAWSAKPAKLGYTRRSIRPEESSSDWVGNSSKTIITTGGNGPPVRAATGPWAESGAGRMSLAAGDMVTNT